MFQAVLLRLATFLPRSGSAEGGFAALALGDLWREAPKRGFDCIDIAGY